MDTKQQASRYLRDARTAPGRRKIIHGLIGRLAIDYNVNVDGPYYSITELDYPLHAYQHRMRSNAIETVQHWLDRNENAVHA